MTTSDGQQDFRIDEPEQRRLLALMASDNAAAAPQFQASSYWEKLNRQLAKRFQNEGILDLEQQGYNRLFSTPGSTKFQRYALWMLYTHVLESGGEAVLDRLQRASLPTPSTEVGRHAVTWDALISLDTLCALAELDPAIWTEQVVVADLGSGWGRVGHVLKLANPNAIYVALDLPASLLIASSVLPTLLDGERFYGYEENREIESFGREQLVEDGGIRLCGAHHLERFAPRSIDFFVNVASFQEMTAAQVDHYLQFVSRTSRHVYLQQRWSRPNSLPNEIIGGFENYAFDPRWERRYLRNVFFSDLFFEAGFSIPEV